MPFFADIGKDASFLTSDKTYKVQNKIDVKHSGPHGLVFTASETRAAGEGKDISGDVGASWKKNALSAGVTVDINGNIKVNAVHASLINGLKSTLNYGTTGTPSVELEYKTGNVGLKTKAPLAMGTIESSVAMGLGDSLTAGAAVDFDASKKSAKNINIGAQYASGNITLASSVALEKQDISVSYVQQLTDDLKIGAAATFGSADPTVRIGMKLALDKDSSITGRVSSSGLIQAAYAQKLRQGLSISLTGDVSAHALSKQNIGVGISLASQ
jgi:hypothetical protein